MINIVIPTYKRANKLVGKNYFKTAKYVLPESQRDDYFKVLPVERMIVIPDEEDGNIARKRNWILRNIERPLLMIDDDVNAIYKIHGRIRLDEKQADTLIRNGFEIAEDCGCKLWGLFQNLDPKLSKEYLPFSFRNLVLGPFMGHFEHDLFYDERMGTKDDYDFSLQVLRKYGKILRINMYGYYCGHGDNEGGIVSMRTMEREIHYCKAIMKKWGKKVIKYRIPPRKMTDLLNGRVSIPIKGV